MPGSARLMEVVMIGKKEGRGRERVDFDRAMEVIKQAPVRI